MEIKITISASKELEELLRTLLQPRLVMETKIEPKEVAKTKAKPVPAAITEPAAGSGSEDEEVDYEALRSQIKTVGADKKAAGKAIAPIFAKYGSNKLSLIQDEDLAAVLEELKNL